MVSALPVIPGYTVKKELGLYDGKRKGGFGGVYLAEHTGSGEVVVLKAVKKKELITKNDWTALRGLMLEVNIQKDLHHTNILPLLAWFQDDHNIYLVLEHAPGGDLEDKRVEVGIAGLERRLRFHEQVAIRYIIQIATGIQELHSRNIVHRDIKDANVLLKDDICKLADFGHACVSSGQTMSELAGSLQFMAPEMLENKEYKSDCYDKKVDLWSLGVLFYRMLTGSMPFVSQPVGVFDDKFQKQLEAIKTTDHKRISDRCRELQLGYETIDLVKKLLTYNSLERISAKEVLQQPCILLHLEKEARKTALSVGAGVGAMSSAVVGVMSSAVASFTGRSRQLAGVDPSVFGFCHDLTWKKITKIRKLKLDDVEPTAPPGPPPPAATQPCHATATGTQEATQETEAQGEMLEPETEPPPTAPTAGNPFSRFW